MAEALGAGEVRAGPPLRIVIALLVVVAIAARWQTFGNPLIQIDEQWYRLVGGRVLDGALPYVDMFDRKPIGIFLIYALARLPGGDGVAASQILSLACVVATAATIFTVARRIAPPLAALAVAVLYLLCLDLTGGESGQSPVFYNLPMALAASLVLRDALAPDATTLRRRGLLAMLLVGVALQIKYSVVFEGLFLGLMLTAASWRVRRSAVPAAADMLVWVGAAVLPTALAAGSFAALGHFHEWYFGNVTANATRASEMPEIAARAFRLRLLVVLPLLAALPLRRWTGATPELGPTRTTQRFVDAWAASALIGVVYYGRWYDHYMLPLYVPFAVAAAPLGRSKAGTAYLVLLIVLAAGFGQERIVHHKRTRGDERVLSELARLSAGQTGCPLVYQAVPAYYDAMGACLPTTRAFPGHLNEIKELGATGIDEQAEVRRIMHYRPTRVVMLEQILPDEYRPARAELLHVLRAKYVLLYRHPNGRRQALLLFALRGTEPGPRVSDAPPAPAPLPITRVSP